MGLQFPKCFNFKKVFTFSHICENVFDSQDILHIYSIWSWTQSQGYDVASNEYKSIFYDLMDVVGYLLITLTKGVIFVIFFLHIWMCASML